MKKWIHRTGIIFLSLAGILLILTLSVNYFFKDQLIKYVVNQLNEQVDARIDIYKVDFSLWKRFPNASVKLEKVLVQSSNKFKSAYYQENKKDTLLLAEEVFLEFNLIRLLSGDYKLDNIFIRNGYLNILVNSKAIANYEILKKAKSDSKSAFKLELKNLDLKNTAIRYNDLKSAVYVSTLAEAMNISGSLGKSLKMSVESSMILKKLSVGNQNYVSNLSLIFNADLAVIDSVFIIHKSELSLNKLPFLVQGEISGGSSAKIRLSVSGNKIQLTDILSTLPKNIRSNTKDYSGKGILDFHMSVSGEGNESPDIKADFSLQDGLMIQKATGMKLKDLNLQGSYRFNKISNYSLFQLNRFSAALGSGSVSGSVLLALSDEPSYKIACQYNLNMNDIKDFINMDKLENFSGNIHGEIVSSGILPEKSFSNIKDLRCNGVANLNDVGLKFRNSSYFFENINGTLVLQNDFIFKSLSVKIHGNDFLLNGSLSGALPLILDQQKELSLKADVFSNHLDLSDYFSTNTEANSDPAYSRELLFPDNFTLDVKLKVNEFKLNKFTAKQISGSINYKPKIFILKSLNLNSLSGKISGNAVVIQDLYKNFIVRGQADISSLDIQQMFFSFNNFSQKVLQDKHLRGRVSGQVGFASEWNNALVLNQDKLLVDADLTITNGQLIHFEPLKGLSKFISVKELENVKFSTLKNRFLIKEKQIVIPQMDIESSAFSISASGIHKFDNHYDYKLKVLLSDVLWHKSKKSRESAEFGEIEEDGLGKFSIPLSITGYGNDFRIKPAPRLLFSDAKDSFRRQKGEMKTIFKEEFGWFKNDTTVTGTKKNDTNAKPRMSWEDKETASDKPAVKTKTEKQRQEKLRVEWE